LRKCTETNVFESENHFNRDFKTENNEQGGTNRANSVCQYCQQCQKREKKKEMGGAGKRKKNPKWLSKSLKAEKSTEHTAKRKSSIVEEVVQWRIVKKAK